MGAVPVARLRKRILERMIERMRAEKDGEEVDIDDDDCPICMEPCQVGEGGGVVTRCGHAFCKPCVLDVLKVRDHFPSSLLIHFPTRDLGTRVRLTTKTSTTPTL